MFLTVVVKIHCHGVYVRPGLEQGDAVLLRAGSAKDTKNAVAKACRRDCKKAHKAALSAPGEA